MLGFSPLASATLADDGVVAEVTNYSLTATDITSGTPAVDSASWIENYTLNPSTVTYTVTVANVGGQDVFVIDGVNNPELTFQRGASYVFDVSDSSNSGHELGFKRRLPLTGYEATTVGVTVYGTAGTSGAYVQIDVSVRNNYTDPNRHTNPMKYYCIVHGEAMGNSITNEYTLGNWGSNSFLDNDQVDRATIYSSLDDAPPDIKTSAPVIEQASISQLHIFSADNIVVQPPIVDQPSVSQVHELDADGITANAPVINTTDLELFIATDSITVSSPVIDAATLTENHNLFADSILNNVPVIDETRILGFAALSRVDIDGANDILLSDSRSDVMITSESRTSVLIEESQILAEVA